MNAETKPTIDLETFMAVDMRVGIVLEVRAFREARKPAWQLHVDFGPELGTRWTSAQKTRFRDGGAVVASAPHHEIESDVYRLSR